MGGGASPPATPPERAEAPARDLAAFSGWNDLVAEAPSTDLAVLSRALFGGIDEAYQSLAVDYAAWEAQAERAAQRRREARDAGIAREMRAARQARATLAADLAAVNAAWEAREAQRAETGHAASRTARVLKESLTLRENHDGLAEHPQVLREGPPLRDGG